MIVNKPHLLTKLQLWFPKYATESGEWEAWLSKTKVHHSSGVIIIEFTKAKHLKEQRFCVRREVAEKCEEATNGKIVVYKVPFSKLEPYETINDIKDTVRGFGW